MNGENWMMKSFMILFCLLYVIRLMEVSRTVWVGCVAWVFSGGLLESNVESKFQKSGKFLGCLCHRQFLKKDFALQRVIWLYNMSAFFLHISVLN